jgi:hypothetical protein
MLSPEIGSVMFALEQDIIHAGAPVLTQAALQAAPIRYHGLAGAKGARRPIRRGRGPVVVNRAW